MTDDSLLRASRPPVRVRTATPDDIAQLLPMLEEFGERAETTPSLWPGARQMTDFLLMVIQKHVVFVAERDEDLLGIIAGVRAPHFINPAIMTIAEILWYVPDAYRKTRAGTLLLKAFIAEGERTADWIVVGQLVPLGRNASRYLERRGFRLQEQSFVRDKAPRSPLTRTEA